MELQSKVLDKLAQVRFIIILKLDLVIADAISCLYANAKKKTKPSLRYFKFFISQLGLYFYSFSWEISFLALGFVRVFK